MQFPQSESGLRCYITQKNMCYMTASIMHMKATTGYSKQASSSQDYRKLYKNRNSIIEVFVRAHRRARAHTHTHTYARTHARARARGSTRRHACDTYTLKRHDLIRHHAIDKFLSLTIAKNLISETKAKTNINAKINISATITTCVATVSLCNI